MFLLLLLACTEVPEEEVPAPETFRVMTFNGGTTTGLAHDADTDDGYTSEHADVADELYENSLSWNPAEEALTGFLGDRRPDLVVFQEIFYDGWCEDIEVDPALDFVCEGYSAERPLQAQRMLGPDYQVVCAPGQLDNCAGVKRSFGAFEGCDADLCLEGLQGGPPESDCSGGARVGYIDVDSDFGPIRLINMHGTSGISAEDQACRRDQIDQIFEAAVGRVLIMGDLNTDPFTMGGLDNSAVYWSTFVGEGTDFHYVSSSEPGGPPTYSGAVRIDHVVSNLFEGDCEVPEVLETVYWDHRPVVCDVLPPE